MIKKYLPRLLFVFALALSNCLSNTAQPSVAGTPTMPPDEYETFPTAMPSNTAKIPVTWANLNLTGKLVYAVGGVDVDNNYIVQIQSLDLPTGNLTVLYTAPVGASIYYTSVSPDGQELVMSYSPPSGENPDVVQALYTLPMDGSRPPQLLFTPPTPEDQYTQAEWSPNGKYIYYTHVNYLIPEDPNRASPLYTLFRMAYPSDQLELVAEAAFWPRLSPDSSRLVYTAKDPMTGEYQIKIADANGENAQEVVISGTYVPEDRDAPIFSPDGGSIIFSGNVPGESYRPNWFDKFTGAFVAKANGEVSDWWSVPVTGGELTRLTNIRHTGLYASISPDKNYIASFSRDNIFVMKPDGSELTVLISELRGFTGTINWIP
jgi:Tol biopolymer transport system component